MANQPPNFWSAAGAHANIPPPYQPAAQPPQPPYPGFWVPAPYPGPPYAAPAPLQPQYYPQYPYPAPYGYTPPPVPAPTPAPVPVPAPTPTPKKAKEKAPKPRTKQPEILPGAQYLYPASHVTVKCIQTQVWKTPGAQFDFQELVVGTSWTVKELIEGLGGGKGYAVTEVVEVGDGTWSKGTTVKHDDKDGAKLNLEKLGWTAKRGNEQEPLYIVLWKGKAAS
ncbi:MAG: hypothetical protein M1828_003224 [Chrysothrix sp. TS-e1954]|nr:MAG: hypothetical protein M1828_003224 [Chrysothrix sp. TS-e1954]